VPVVHGIEGTEKQTYFHNAFLVRR
jgi:hypothetical protein